ncbi:hypothetical protein O181_104890 [Austropuccinia psidii MF-1]|uniref:Uncharacterized protein n=1 Tax=Austropuccinia psidii MF-1 TaxID=1389203 RepID=A0A9Q3PL56_9BASI|nr:hypothetical protein [Austropuccinia psidii MF-1]
MHRAKLTKSLATRLSHSLYSVQGNSTATNSRPELSEDLFCGKKQAIPLLILTFDSYELTLPPFVQTSQYNEPLIPGSSQSSKSQLPSHEDALTCEPGLEMAPMKSKEDPFGKFPTFTHPSFQLILLPPLHNNHLQYTCWLPPGSFPRDPSHCPENPTTSSPYSHNEAQKEFTNLQLTLLIPQAILNK